MVIYTEQDKYLDRAERLADELEARITRDRSDAEAQGVFLQIDEEGKLFAHFCANFATKLYIICKISKLYQKKV